MLPSGSNLAQSQITIVSDLSDGKAGSIKCTRHYTSRTAAAFPQHEIAERIAFPTGHRPHDRIGGEMLPTRRRIKRDPTA
jgi:hypothetical protein